MRLFVTTKEVPLLKNALQEALNRTEKPVELKHLGELLERVELCEKLQKSEHRAKKEEDNNYD